jgi:hypothetical protein
MQTFKNIYEFISETFSVEYEKMYQQKQTSIERFIEDNNFEFNEKLNAIINGEEILDT